MYKLRTQKYTQMIWFGQYFDKFMNVCKCVYFYYFFFVVVLLDTTKEATLEWTRYPYGPQAQTPGVSTFVLMKDLKIIIFFTKYFNVSK